MSDKRLIDMNWLDRKHKMSAQHKQMDCRCGVVESEAVAQSTRLLV